MLEQDKRELAAEYVRQVASDFGAQLDEAEFNHAVEQAASALPPYPKED